MLQDEDDEEEEARREAGGRRHSATETVMVEKSVRLQLESKELKERLMVSEATVHAQAEQLKDYRELLSESLYTYTENIHAYHRMLLRRGLLIIMAGKNTIKYNVADSLH